MTGSLPLLAVGGERHLTVGEQDLARSMFGEAIDFAPVTIRRRKWFLLQPREVAMAPDGHIYFHPEAIRYRDDFSTASVDLQGLFLHEMTHVWQTQQRGRWYLPIHRHPFCRYHYAIRPGWKLHRYGIEQQAEIVRHAFFARRGIVVPGSPGSAVLESILPFNTASPTVRTV